MVRPQANRFATARRFNSFHSINTTGASVVDARDIWDVLDRVRFPGTGQRINMTILLRTIHGSHLYGLAHADSDTDIYEVFVTTRTARKRNIKQTISNGVDKTSVDMSTFMHMVDECVPQALEALWSPVAEIDKIHEFRTQYRVNSAKMKEVYVRTALKFVEEGTVKHRRHALRLILNLGTALEYGKFNPQLSATDLIILNAAGSTEIFEHVFYSTLEFVQQWV